MYREFLQEARFFRGLLELDREIAAEVRAQGCDCGGVLHTANFPRRPRGIFFALEAELLVRFSFCCNRDGCRRRVTPPSVRFLGRRVYAAAAFLLASVLLSERLSEAVVGKVEHEIGISFRTLKRWRQWWRGRFTGSSFWQAARARFSPPVAEDAGIAAAILNRFHAAHFAERLRFFLRFLSPLSTASCAMKTMVSI